MAGSGGTGGLVVLHIGLPKTGTTHLQHHIFARLPEITFLHRQRSDEGRRICRELRHMVTGRPLTALLRRWRLDRALRSLVAQGKPVLVSYENIAMAPNGLWTGEGPSPEAAALRLGALATALAPVRLRVVLGIRRQDRWLASRYAESSRDFPEFGQADFDARMAALAARPELGAVEAWLDHDRSHAALTAALGPDNVFLLPTERLSDEAVYPELGAFIGGVELLRLHRKAVRRRAQAPRNALSSGGDEWRLRRDGSPLHLSPEIAAAVAERFAVSNRRLGERCPLGLAAPIPA